MRGASQMAGRSPTRLLLDDTDQKLPLKGPKANIAGGTVEVHLSRHLNCSIVRPERRRLLAG